MSSQFKKFSCLSEAVEHKACCGDFDECLRALHTGTRDPCSIARLRPSQTRLRSTIHVRPVILAVVFTDLPSIMSTEGQAARPACRRVC